MNKLAVVAYVSMSAFSLTGGSKEIEITALDIQKDVTEQKLDYNAITESLDILYVAGLLSKVGMGEDKRQKYIYDLTGQRLRRGGV